MRFRTRPLLAAAVATAVLAGGAALAAPAAAGSQTLCNVPLRMSDGTDLRANVVTSPRGGKQPTILIVTGYNKDLTSPVGGCSSADQSLTDAGYNVMVVDDRGTGSSEGGWDIWGVRTQQDYSEVLAWLKKQPWHDGNVGTTGGSYLGITSLLVAERGDPQVKAVWADVPMSDAYRDVTYFGGNLDTAFMSVWAGFTQATNVAPSKQALDGSGDPQRVVVNEETQLANGPAAIVGGQVLASGLTGRKDGDAPPYDSAAQRLRSPAERASKITAAVFWTGGWFDIFQRGEAYLFNSMTNTPPGGKKWVQGPIYHTGGDDHWDKLGLGTRDQTKIRWFDRWLRGKQNGIDKIDPIHHWVVGAEKFETAKQWPPAGVTWTRSHLSAEPSGTSAAVLHDGSLAAAPRGNDQVLLPYSPVGGLCNRSTVQWSGGAGGGNGMPCDEEQSAAGATNVAFTGEELKKPLHLHGPMALDLWAAFDTYDSNIYAALVDVAPDGTQRQITTGGLMASHRALDPRRSLKTPGGDVYLPYHPFTQAAQTDLVRAEPTRLQVEMYPTDWQVPAGHQVRLLIGTSDTPHYAPPADRLAKMLGGTVRILTGPQYPSRLVLPVQAPVR